MMTTTGRCPSKFGRTSRFGAGRHGIQVIPSVRELLAESRPAGRGGANYPGAGGSEPARVNVGGDHMTETLQSQPLIRPISDEEAGPEVRRIFDAMSGAGALVAPFSRMLAHKPAILRAITNLAERSGRPTRVSPRSSRTSPICELRSSMAASIEHVLTPPRRGGAATTMSSWQPWANRAGGGTRIFSIPPSEPSSASPTC